jgi:replicative DNA helicase
MYFNRVLTNIEKGREGLNKGLPFGIDKLVKVVPNIQKSTYYLIGAEPSTGKTAMVDDCFMYSPFEYVINNPQLNIKIDFIYFSPEVTLVNKITKGICRRIYLDFNKIVDIQEVLSRGKSRISGEIYEHVMSTRKYFEQLEDSLHIIENNTNPTGVRKYVESFMNKHGKTHTKTIIIDGKPIEVFDRYEYNHPDHWVFLMYDHLALAKGEQGKSKKETIDLISENGITLKNRYELINVFSQQLGRNLSSTDRFKLGRIEPQLSDFKETGDTQEDADIIFSLFNPFRYELKEYKSYKDLSKTPGFRYLTVLKNRDGEADVGLPLNLIGQCGKFTEFK